MGRSTSELRELWKTFECNEIAMVPTPFPDRIRVAPPTLEAWKALSTVFEKHRYLIRTEDTDSYNCRKITGGEGKSLHSYGIALDINWKTNPYTDHDGTRKVRFSSKLTQAERAIDVKERLSDTDMTPELHSGRSRSQNKSGIRRIRMGRKLGKREGLYAL